MNRSVLAVCAADIQSEARARAAAEMLGVPLIGISAAADGERVLRFAANGVTFGCGGMELKGDLANLARRARGANLREELIVRAAKAKETPRPRVLDATAGLGEDSFLLAACGCEVTLYERSGAVFLLLEDSLRRAKEDPSVSVAAVRMTAIYGDSIPAMKNAAGAYDLILLDPMFPEREKSALVKKKLQLIQQLEPPCADEEELLCAAFAARPRRIIVKRPPKGPYLAGRKPDHSLTGKAVRFDVFTLF